MKIEEFNNKLLETAKKMDINLEENMLEQFFKYMELLIEWNKNVNLTSIVEPDEVIVKHFIDSLTIKKYVSENSKIIDVGTGAGFPGIPLKIIDNSLDVTLLDSLNKRINFLNEVNNQLKLKNVKSIHGRAEDYGQNIEYREKYDIVVSRAVANLSVLAEYMLPFIKVNGICICMKGSNIEEVENAKNAIKKLGGEIEKIDNFVLPDNGIRNIIIIRKIKKTEKTYPRKSGTPGKEPLK